MNSRQKFLGVYRTAETYQGKHGYSLRLDGLSPGKNSNARKRAIVVHGRTTPAPGICRSLTSWGAAGDARPCQGEQSRAIIDTIKGGERHLCPWLRACPRACCEGVTRTGGRRSTLPTTPRYPSCTGSEMSIPWQ